MNEMLRQLWRRQLRPAYNRLIQRYFDAILQWQSAHAQGLTNVQMTVNHSELMLRDVQQEIAVAQEAVRHLQGDLQNHVHGLNTRQGAVNADVVDRLVRLEGIVDALDEHVRLVVAVRWEHEALTRRLAAIEDRLLDGGPHTGAPAADSAAAVEGSDSGE